jgi:hypothetical protein
MSEFIICSNCNKNVGAIIPAYIYLRDMLHDIYLKENFEGNTPHSMLTNPAYNLELGTLMDAFNINPNVCYACRYNMLGMITNPSLYI